MGQAEQPLPSMSAGVDGPTHWKVIQPIKLFECVCQINAALYVSDNGRFQALESGITKPGQDDIVW